MTTGTQDRLVAAALLCAVAAAAGLEGAVVRLYGGVSLAAAALVAGVYVFGRGVEAPGRALRVAALLGGAVLAWQVAPIPPALRALVAPGQARWMARVDPSWSGSLHEWLAALAVYDVEAATGTAGTWGADLLAGSAVTAWHAGAAAPEEWAWCFALVACCFLVFLAGKELGRDERVALGVCVVLVLFGLAEVGFGLANRNGPSTGIGPKAYYIGSVTGTFVNRGDLAAFACLSVGAAWGLAASMFPLLSEEARRHAKHRRRSSQPPTWLEAGGDRLPRLALLAFCGAVLALGIVASQSRGPLLGLAGAGIGMAAWMTLRRKESFYLVIGLGLPIAGLLLAVASFGVGGAVGRFVSLVSGADVSVTSRLAIWSESLRGWLDAPILGAGLGAWRHVHAIHEVAPHLYSVGHAHDEPIEWLVDVGLVGMVALGIAGWCYVRASRLALAEVEHDGRTAVGVGMLVGVGAVTLQSLGDFPFRTPGVALPAALCAGLAMGALRPAPESRSKRWTLGVVAVGLAGALLAVNAAAADARFHGTRNERVGSIPTVWYAGDGVRTVREARAWSRAAEEAARRSPLDPWTHMSVARARSLLALAADGGDAEEHAYAADLALARARALRRRSPRMDVQAAGILLRLGRATLTPDAFAERALQRLEGAVSMDSWRAQEAFDTAETLPEAALARIAEAAAAEPAARSRVLYEYGRALERRGRKEQALAVHLDAHAADPRNGSPAFAAGVLLHGMGKTDDGRRMLRAFLSAPNRPGGMEGWALILLDELDAADARLRHVVGQTPANRWAWEGLAEVARRRGDARSELVAWRKIRDLAPKDAAVRARVEALEAAAAGR